MFWLSLSLRGIASMNRKLLFTISALSIVSLSLTIYCILQVKSIDIWNLIYWIVLTSLLESLPIYIKEDRAVSVSFAVLLACHLNNGPYFTALVASCGSVLVFIKNQDGTWKHPFNLPFYKTLMNYSNFTISIFTAGVLYDTWIKTYPVFINPILNIVLIFLYLTVVFLLNSTIMALYTSLMRKKAFQKTWTSETLWAYPNFIAIAPLGYFLSVLYRIPNGSLYVLLLLGPLLLARHSFKLYLDSREQYYKTIRTLTAAIEAKDKYTEGHSKRVEYYAGRIARKLRVSSGEAESIRTAALLHDIGKIGIRDSVLSKPDRLSDEELAMIRQHPGIGIKILEEVTFPGHVKDAILHHHERYDGDGYPDNLKGDQVSRDAYILAAADAYDAMTSDRPYRKAMSRDAAIENIRKEKGAQFHPDIADALISVLEEEGAVDSEKRKDGKERKKQKGKDT
jgi:putative nucleotidyltransferase with HDIG domain